MNNPIRRNIIRAIRKGHKTIEELQEHLNMDPNTVKWHIKILEDGYCLEIKKQDGKECFNVTDEGDVVDFIEG